MAAEKILLMTQKEIAGGALASEIVAAQIAKEVVFADDTDDFCALFSKDAFLAVVADDPDDGQRQLILEKAGKVPVVFLCSGTIEKSAAFVVLKPFRLSAVLSVLMSAAGRFKNSGDAVVALGKASFHPVQKTVSDAKETVTLTEKETALLSALIDAKTPVTKETLLRDVWNAADGVDSHTPETHISSLRQKLAPFKIEINAGKDGYFLKA